jgi:hypothetical protein
MDIYGEELMGAGYAKEKERRYRNCLPLTK